MDERNLALAVVQEIGGIPNDDMDSVKFYESVGEWGQVATSALVGALRIGKQINPELVKQAIEYWGEPEMGALMDEFAARWVSDYT